MVTKYGPRETKIVFFFFFLNVRINNSYGNVDLEKKIIRISKPHGPYYLSSTQL